jgi:hypothetical protein
MRTAVIFIIVFSCAVISCDTSRDVSPSSSLLISVTHLVDNKPLAWDSLIYQNAKAESYSLSRLEYYISQFRFYKNNAVVYSIDTVLYVDAHNNNAILINNPPAFYFDSIGFYIAVDTANNINGKLTPTAENIEMEWPQGMGGGYHFLKMEGHWQDGPDYPGFAMHVGTTSQLVSTGVKGNYSVESSKVNKFILTMNINEWFTHPYNYSFKTDGNYTMGDATLMQKISTNGKDVFTISK